MSATRNCVCATVARVRRSCCCTATPRTHATWRQVAPLLAERFTVVCPDLRGCGESSKPPTTPDHAPYSKPGHGR